MGDAGRVLLLFSRPDHGYGYGYGYESELTAQVCQAGMDRGLCNGGRFTSSGIFGVDIESFLPLGHQARETVAGRDPVRIVMRNKAGRLPRGTVLGVTGSARGVIRIPIS